MKINIKLQEGADLPSYAHYGDAGFDIKTIENDTILHPLERKLFKTGIFLEIPIGYNLEIRSRSGLALNSGILVLNSPGTIDPGYRGEIGIILFNTSNKDVLIKKGDRIAQGILTKCETADFCEVSNLSETSRNEKGFGSSGK